MSAEQSIRPREHGRFVRGHVYSRETQFKVGVRVSAATEFKKGQPAHNKLPVGSVTERRDPHGNYRAWVKVGEPNKWRPRAVVVWESHNGPLPRGRVVHHKDRNSLNDAPWNLAALTRKEHAAAHRDDLNESRAPETFTRAWHTRRQKKDLSQ